MRELSLQAPYLDTSADQLCFSLHLDERPALAERTVHVAGLAARIRLLGASHQVFAGPVRETVACLPGAARGLPAELNRQGDGWTYVFAAETVRHEAAEFSTRVASIRDRATEAEHSLCGIFPGSPDALTAVVVEEAGEVPPGSLSWRTWHTYPQDGQIVTTHSRLETR